MTLCILCNDSSEVKYAIDKLKELSIKNITHIYLYVKEQIDESLFVEDKKYYLDTNIYFFIKSMKDNTDQILLWSQFSNVLIWFPFYEIHDYSQRLLDRYAYSRTKITQVVVDCDKFVEVKPGGIFND